MPDLAKIKGYRIVATVMVTPDRPIEQITEIAARVGIDMQSFLQRNWKSIADTPLQVEPITNIGVSARELLFALKSIHRYGADTLSGRVDGPDDREWQRAAVLEMTNRAIAIITKAEASTE